MIRDIKKSIENEINMLKEIAEYSKRLYSASPDESKLLMQTINSLRDSMRAINSSIPSLLNDINIEIPKQTSKKDFQNVVYRKEVGSYKSILPNESKEKLINELGIEEDYIKKLKVRKKEKEEVHKEFKVARGYVRLSNKVFLRTAENLIGKGYFKKLPKDLQKANIEILSHSYMAMTLMSSFLALICGLILAVILFFFNFSISPPFIVLFEGDYLDRFLKIFWVPIVIPLATFIALYCYPATEKAAFSKNINQELPFAIIHMSAISGSGIQPADIFKIIGLSKEYPYLRKEIRKVLNQINIYGYDLVTALNNAASSTSSIKLAELFSGLATTINSGGSFQEFFEKRANTLLVDYRLERQKYAKTTEAFMDVYISVVIAAPMIMMLFLIILTVGNFSVGMTTGQLTFLIIAITAAINIVFLIFLHVYQPSY